MSTLTTAGITFGDATSQTTAATAAALVTTTNVLNATAGASVGAVGTYAILMTVAINPAGLSAGSTIAGSSLRYTYTTNWQDSCGSWSFRSLNSAPPYSGTPSGTWRHMGFWPANTIAQPASLFLRIS